MKRSFQLLFFFLGFDFGTVTYQLRASIDSAIIVTKGGSLVRKGYNTDLASVIILEISLLIVVLLMAGYGFAYYVQRGLDDLVGGKDYQVVAQVDKQETNKFVAALQETYKGREGFRFRIGKVLGDKIHILIGFGDQDLKNGALDEVTKLISPLPGYAGLALLLDPAVLVRGIPSEVYPGLIKEINTWSETRYAAKGPMGLYVVAKDRKKLGTIENKLVKLTSPYYLWEVDLKTKTNQEAALTRERIDKILQGKKHWYLTSPIEGVVGDAVRLLKGYSSKLVFNDQIPVGADLVLSSQNLKIGSKPSTQFKARVFTDGIYLTKGDSLQLTGRENAYLLDGTGRLTKKLSGFELESPRKDLEIWQPVTDISELKVSAQELAEKIREGEDFSLLLRDIEQLARKQSLKVPDEIKSKLELLILWDRIGKLPTNIRTELADKIIDWVKAMPADPLLKLKESLPSWSDEDITRSWRDLESVSQEKVLRVVTTETAPKIEGLVSKPAAEVREDIKSQIGEVVGGIVPLAALAVAVILFWIFTALDHTLWGSYMVMKNNYLAPLWGWLLGLLELSVVVLLMPYDTTILVKIIYILAGAIGSAFIITLSNRISPINSKSIEAGEALGLSKAELFRQVIVPDGRPGLWQIYNRGKLLSLRRFRNA